MSGRQSCQLRGQVRSVRSWLLLTAFFLLATGCAERGKPTEVNFNAVKEGMTREQVEALLGLNHDVVKDVQFSQVIQQNPQAEWRRWRRPRPASQYERPMTTTSSASLTERLLPKHRTVKYSREVLFRTSRRVRDRLAAEQGAPADGGRDFGS